MGVVIRQSFWSMLAIYLGIGIGFINAVILMPKFLTPEETGLFRTIASCAMLLQPFVLFGMGHTLVTFFPRVDDKSKGALLSLGLLVILGLNLITAILVWLFSPFIGEFFAENANEVNAFHYLIIAMTLCMSGFTYLETASKINLKTVFPSILREPTHKSLHTIILVSCGIGLIVFKQYLHLQIAIYLVIVIVLLAYNWKKGFLRLVLRPWNYDLKFREILTYSAFTTVGGLGMVTVIQIDQIMVSKYLGLTSNAVYTTAVFMAIVIEIPKRVVTSISTPILSVAYKQDNWPEINKINHQSSVNMFLIASFIFMSILSCLPAIYELMPKGDVYSMGYWIFCIVGITKLTNLAMGMTSEIISISHLYKLIFILVMGLAIVSIGLNIIFIPNMGLEGAALATLISFLIFNLSKGLILYRHWKMNPLALEILKMIPILIACYISSLFIKLPSPILSILFNLLQVAIWYSILVFVIRPSPELINAFKNLVLRAKELLFRRQ